MASCRHGWAAPRVLVIEDEGIIATLAADVLADEGYEAQRAGDGRAALALVRGWAPCLILLDIMMPVMDGRAFLRELRRLDGHAALPVVVVSGAGGPLLSDLGMEVADVVSKPYRVELLLEIVARLIT
jgi:CheY-like chemotaxis protein